MRLGEKGRSGEGWECDGAAKGGRRARKEGEEGGEEGGEEWLPSVKVMRP